MKVVGLIQLRAGLERPMFLYNLGRVLADTGLRVLLVDLDPQAGLTELTGASSEVGGSIVEVFSELGPTTGERAIASEMAFSGDVEPVSLGPGLSLVRGHLELARLDDVFSLREASVEAGFRTRFRDAVAESEFEPELVLCDLAPNLGPLNRFVLGAVDDLIVGVSTDPSENTALRLVGEALRRWRRETSPGAERSPRSYCAAGYVVLGARGRTLGPLLERLAVAYRAGALGGEEESARAGGDALGSGDPACVGVIQGYPSLASTARLVHKAELDLTFTDGVTRGLFEAQRDLRGDYERVAARFVAAAGLLEDDEFVASVEEALSEAAFDEFPRGVEGLSSHTHVDRVSNVELTSAAIAREGFRVTGTASVEATLTWGGGAARDGLEVPESVPVAFDVTLDRSRESVHTVHRFEVEASWLDDWAR